MSELLNNAVIEIVIGGSINVTKNDEFRRVIAFMIGDNEVVVPIGENMTLNKIVTKNVSKLWIRPNNSSSEWKEVAINTSISENISGDYDLMVKVERPLTDPQASVYIKTTTIE